mgnify:CR=1 FL=1
MSKSKANEETEGKPRFNPPARRAYGVARRGDPRFITLTNDEGGHCTGYVLKDPEGYELIAKMSADGCALSVIAYALGIDTSTFTNLRKRDPLAQEMVDLGRAVLTSEVVDTAVQHMREGNLTACIWLGKVRCGLVEQSGEVEGATPPAKITNNTQINITLSPAMSDEQFAELRKITALPSEPVDLTPAKPRVLK